MREGLRITGFAGLPTYHRATSQAQYLFVNRRPVRDRLLLGVIRAAYQDFLRALRERNVPTRVVREGEEKPVAAVRFRPSAEMRGRLKLADLKWEIGDLCEECGKRPKKKDPRCSTCKYCRRARRKKL